MKKYHPGTVYKINGVVVRARVKDSRNVDIENIIQCKENSIIFIKP